MATVAAQLSPSSTASTLATPTGLPSGASTIPENDLLLWLRSEDLLTAGGACDGSGISSWRNAAPLAGNYPFNHTAENLLAVGNGLPVNYRDEVSGQCVARFSAAQSSALAVPYMDLTGATTSFTVTLVARMRGPQRKRVLSGYRRIDSDADMILGWWENTADGFYLNGWLSSGRQGGLTSAATRDEAWVMYTIVRDGPRSSGRLFKHGNIITEGTINSGFNGLVLGGGLRGGSYQGYWELSDCDIAEVIVYDTALQTAQRHQLEGYLAAKHQFRHLLPAIHPYYDARPSAPFSGVPQPLMWMRPEELPADTNTTIAYWPNAGSGGSTYAMINTASPSTAPSLIRSSFFLDGAPHSAVRFTRSRGTRLWAPIDLGSQSTQRSLTAIYVGRYWGSATGRVFTSTSDQFLIGYFYDRMDVCLAPGYWMPGVNGDSSSPLASVENGAYLWQTYGWSLRGSNSTHQSEAIFYKGARELSRAYNQYGFANPQLGCWLEANECSDSDVAEVMIWDRVLSSDEYSSAISYLQARYGRGIGNLPVTASASLPPSASNTASPSTGASSSSSVTPSATVNRCATDESFAAPQLPAGWIVQPASLVSFPVSVAPRGNHGSVVTDLCLPPRLLPTFSRVPGQEMRHCSVSWWKLSPTLFS